MIILNPYLPDINSQARVPEHSIALMAAMSDARPLLVINYLFFARKDWLIALGWPLLGKFDEADFMAALDEVQSFAKVDEIYFAGPALPKPGQLVESDDFYVLSANAEIPTRLVNTVKRSSEALIISEGTDFTPEHRKLWAEFLEKNASRMNDRVAQLYLRTPQALARGSGNLRLLDARHPDGRLAASLLLDYSAKNFTSYVIGAHSKANYFPHATDALFARMLENARRAGKSFIHLGLGVNEGILRFKKKWGAVKASPYVMAQWQGRKESAAKALILALANAGSGVDAKKLLDEAPQRKPFAMLWQIEKNGKTSWLGGTAHFFCCSFEPSFRKLFKNVDNVIFEGPLDEGFMTEVEERGKRLAPGRSPLIKQIDEKTIRNLEGLLLEKGWNKGELLENPPDIRSLLSSSQPWHVFFTLWTAFLARQGWKESVDMEAWRTARAMDKNVIAMENMEEQLESLGSLPEERVINFFRNCGDWKKRASRNKRAYLAGDLEKMMGSSAEFPTRTEHIVGRRDQRFRERMRPWLEKGNTAVFVGCAHLVNLRHMLEEDGFRVIQKPFGLFPKLCLRWRNAARPDRGVKW